MSSLLIYFSLQFFLFLLSSFSFLFSHHDGFHDKTKGTILFWIPNSYLPFKYRHNPPSRLFNTLTRAWVRSTLFVLTPPSLRIFPSFGFTFEFSDVSPTILGFEFFFQRVVKSGLFPTMWRYPTYFSFQFAPSRFPSSSPLNFPKILFSSSSS